MLFVLHIAPPLLPLPIPAHCQFSCDEKKGQVEVSHGFGMFWMFWNKAQI